jgi:hypothetical protein
MSTNPKNNPHSDRETNPGTANLPDSEAQVCRLEPEQRLQPGMRCPRCKEGLIDYNGMLNLVCPHCGLTEAGACT